MLHANAQSSGQSRHPIALITGGSRGIGSSTALALAERGIDVILTYVSAEDAAEQVVRRIRDAGRKAVALRLDVSKTDTFETFVGEVRRTVERVWSRDSFDFLVNNAGAGGYTPFAQTSEATFDELVAVHFKGPFFLTQKLLPLLVGRRRPVEPRRRVVVDGCIRVYRARRLTIPPIHRARLLPCRRRAHPPSATAWARLAERRAWAGSARSRRAPSPTPALHPPR